MATRTHTHKQIHKQPNRLVAHEVFSRCFLKRKTLMCFYISEVKCNKSSFWFIWSGQRSSDTNHTQDSTSSFFLKHSLSWAVQCHVTADPSLTDQSCHGVRERSLKLLPFLLPVQPEVEEEEQKKEVEMEKRRKKKQSLLWWLQHHHVVVFIWFFLLCFYEWFKH